MIQKPAKPAELAESYRSSAYFLSYRNYLRNFYPQHNKDQHNNGKP